MPVSSHTHQIHSSFLLSQIFLYYPQSQLIFTYCTVISPFLIHLPIPFVCVHLKIAQWVSLLFRWYLCHAGANTVIILLFLIGTLRKITLIFTMLKTNLKLSRYKVQQLFHRKCQRCTLDIMITTHIHCTLVTSFRVKQQWVLRIKTYESFSLSVAKYKSNTRNYGRGIIYVVTECCFLSPFSGLQHGFCNFLTTSYTCPHAQVDFRDLLWLGRSFP